VYISGTEPGRAGADVYSFWSGLPGPSYVPFNVPGDPGETGFSVKNLSVDQKLSERLDDRVALLSSFDGLRRSVDESGLMNAMDRFNRQAVSMLTSDKARIAFDLGQEPQEPVIATGVIAGASAAPVGATTGRGWLQLRHHGRGESLSVRVPWLKAGTVQLGFTRRQLSPV
jgi:hypothetical protein